MKNLSIGRCAAGAVALALAGSATAQTPQPAASLKVDSETISGLGARNIGSAAMSGRIAAGDALSEGHRLTAYARAASGGVVDLVLRRADFHPAFHPPPVPATCSHH